MSDITLTINGRTVRAESGDTILTAARRADIYIPALCHHPDLPPGNTADPVPAVFRGSEQHDHTGPDGGQECGLCVVEIKKENDLQPACATEVVAGMAVTTDSDRVTAARREKLADILAGHPHACLTCAQNEGCVRTQCSSNVPENERCCPQLGHCELQAVAEYIGIPENTPRWRPTQLPVLDGPLFTRDYNLCIGCTRCVRACRDLRGVQAIGFVRDAHGRVIVGSVGPTLEDSGCRFCTACVEVCPTGALMDKNVKVATRERDLVPCRAACPAGIDIPRYLRLIAEGRFDEAHSVIREKTPLPGVLGRVCIRPCEDACRRGEVNEPIAVCALKRAAADRESGGWENARPRAADTGRRAAVVGAGPAGLTCAFYLRRAGHQVTLFESEPEAGGMLRYGLPEYRLPREVLDREIRHILDLGIELRTGAAYGRDFTAASLQADGFEAVFLALGAPLARAIPLEGSEKDEVLWGVDFLRAVNLGQAPSLSGRVVVIGGGNVALDVALTARRTGAGRVDLVCLEQREEMPAHEWECRGALTEGIHFHNGWGPLSVTGDGRVAGIRLIRCTRVFDDQCVFKPEFDPADTMELLADHVILAVGQDTNPEPLAGDPGLAVRQGRLQVNEDQSTTLAGVWAGGDMAALPGSVIEAVAAGRRAAAAMDRALGGTGDIEETLLPRTAPDPFLGRVEGFPRLVRETMPYTLPEARAAFEEIELGFDQDQARAEAARCLQCDLRLSMGTVLFPPEKWLPFNDETLERAPRAEGVFTLYDRDKNTLAIKGALDLGAALEDARETFGTAAFVEWEEDKMYTKRESELLQQYMLKHGEMPRGDEDELDDLF